MVRLGIGVCAISFTLSQLLYLCCNSGVGSKVDCTQSDFLGDSHDDRQPQMESAVIGVVRWMILEGLSKHRGQGGVSAEMIAATASWAIYGAAKEWVRTPNRCRSEEIVETVAALVSPILHA